jgi:hypothetical protein
MTGGIKQQASLPLPIGISQFWSSLLATPPSITATTVAAADNSSPTKCLVFKSATMSPGDEPTSPLTPRHHHHHHQFLTPQTTPTNTTSTKSLLTTPTQFPGVTCTSAYLFGSPANANTSLISQSPKVLVSNHQLLSDLKQLNLYDQNNNNDSEANQNKTTSSTTTATNELDGLGMCLLLLLLMLVWFRDTASLRESGSYYSLGGVKRRVDGILFEICNYIFNKKLNKIISFLNKLKIFIFLLYLFFKLDQKSLKKNFKFKFIYFSKKLKLYNGIFERKINGIMLCNNFLIVCSVKNYIFSVPSSTLYQYV